MGGRQATGAVALCRESSQATSTQVSAKKSQEEINTRRAIALAHDGAIGKAARALSSSGVHAITPTVQQALLSKHPQVQPEHELVGNAPFPSDRHTALLDSVKPEDITACVKKFPRASAGGGTGLTPTHLKEMLRLPEASEGTGLLTALACLVSQLAKGNVPARIAPWLAGAPSPHFANATAVFAQ